MSPIQRHVSRLVRWHFWSSTTFEIMKASHQTALFIVLSPASYGHIGSIFAMIYLCATIFGFEAGNALIPFANSIANSPERANIITRYLIAPQFIIQMIGASIVHNIITMRFLPTPKPLYCTLIIAITTLEGIRMAARTVAHTITDSTTIIPAEVGLTTGYFLFIWTGYTAFNMPLNIQTILIPYLVTSIIGTSFLVNAIYHYPSTLPKRQTPILPTPQENIRIRTSLTILHLPQNLFSANFLVPLFSQTIGYRFAGFIKLASEGAQAIKAIIKACIGFSANAIFSTYVKSRTLAFNMLWKLLINGTTYTLIISAMTALPCFIIQFMQKEGAMLMAFSILCMVDYLFIIYEHFFVVANTSAIIARYRIIEIAISTAIIIATRQSPIIAIACLIAVRIVSLSATILCAHRLWRITPKLSIEGRHIAGALCIGLMFGIASAHVKLKTLRGAQQAASNGGAPYSPLSEKTTITE